MELTISGILALPVKTASSGFWPFFIVLMFVLLLEEAVVIFGVVRIISLKINNVNGNFKADQVLIYLKELLQKTHTLVSRGINDYNKFKKNDEAPKASDDEQPISLRK